MSFIKEIGLRVIRPKLRFQKRNDLTVITFIAKLKDYQDSDF